MSERRPGSALATHGRYEYVSITRRRNFRWPGGSKLAVYFALGLEQYDFGQGMTENLVAGMPPPDVLNTSWRDYGNRVGAWRILECFAQYGIPLGILLNSALCEHAPELIQACRAADCELIAHGYSNSDTLAGMTEAQESAYLRQVAEQMQRFSGRPPAGWASPWIAETPLTPDLLHESGYEYLLDWCMDDQPVWLRTRGGHILSVPYTQELNDSSAIIGRCVDANDFASMIIDQFEEMRQSGGEQPLVMSVVLHSFISGQPFRLRALRRALEHIARARTELWLTQPGAIARHFSLLER
jgi:peptidoglycan/xylan/chitin deacetylase (PgdA/CDA1 family)